MLRVDDEQGLVKDELGRMVMLRGVNLCGTNKIPFFNTHEEFLEEYRKAILLEPHKISFVGRPFPIGECDEHFARLKSWGLTFHRLLVPWEAIEHAGPGLYDEEYLNYLEEVVTIGEKYGMHFHIDPHQDVWSRLTCGDGAPGWTFDKVGFIPANFNTTAASHTNIEDPLHHHDWPDEYGKLAPCTMFTLFFGGNDFAPLTKIDGESAQDYLQYHYANAYKALMKRLGQHNNVVGNGTMNEPSHGFINWEDLTVSAFRWQFRLPKMRDQVHSGVFSKPLHKKSASSIVNLRMKITPTPFQAMKLGDGMEQMVERWGILFGPMTFGKQLVNPNHIRVWKEGYECVWKQNGVWGIDKNGNEFIKKDYFTQVNGKKIIFETDYLRPFANYMAKEIRSVAPAKMIFVQSTPMFPLCPWKSDDGDAGNVVNSSHWYDYFTLFTGLYLSFFSMNFYENGKFVFGAKKRQRMFMEQLASIMESSKNNGGDMPDLIGELGIAFNRHHWWEGLLERLFGMQTFAMNASFKAIEALMLNASIYNYTPKNTNKYGDGWNGEDLSIFSRDQQKNPNDINSGARALKGFLRPYPMKISGKTRPVKIENGVFSLDTIPLSFDMKKRTFKFRFDAETDVKAPTEIFIPNAIYPKGFNIITTKGRHSFDPENQILTYYHDGETGEHQILITPK